MEMNKRCLVTTSRGIAMLPGLAELLGAEVLYRPWSLHGADCSAVLAWGRKPSAAWAEHLAANHGLPVLRLEDGFVRSMGLGPDDSPLSLVVDGEGIYYDASRPSRLECCVRAGYGAAERERAGRLGALWRRARVSKYNQGREFAGPLPLPYVLVADQTRGDASVRYGWASEHSFAQMLAAALAENPACTVLLKVHPDVLAGRKRGYFDLAQVAQHPRVQVMGLDVHPVGLIEQASAVYVVTSQIGFEGLLWGKRVHTFGMPFYAGWGLTQDALPAPPRRSPARLEDLVHAALVDYPRYLDPDTGRPCDVERLVEWCGFQRTMRARFPAEVYALDFSLWKKSIVRSFFSGSAVRFVRHVDDVPGPATLAVWGRKPLRGTLAAQVSVVRLEDGFIRSVGLGADLVRPLSWVMDRVGIHYDSAAPSDLEFLLLTTAFDEDLLGRARRLRERLVEGGVTKYNLAGRRWMRPAASALLAGGVARPDDQGPSGLANGRTVILVPGQVESDASLAHGAPGIRRNIDLLQAVRTANPDAYIVYKPHPDVVAGLRRRGQGERGALRWCDEVVDDVDLDLLLQQVDEVHTLTSQSGFEALLRGKRVVCHGQPFYAGWGLTEDILPIPRRTRRLALDALVAGVLILYPVYVHRKTGKFTTPEQTLDDLMALRREGASSPPWWRLGLRKLLGLGRG